MYSINCSGKLLFTEKPLIMGILNLTEDSFYKGSRLGNNMEAIKDQAIQMLNEGADILDLGAQSTRPGSSRFSADKELEKLLPVIKLIREINPDAIISVDTYHAETAEKVISFGASIINDISGGEMDMNMIKTVADMQVPYICMHMKGVPETMQNNTQYEDVTKEILDYFIAKIEECRAAGIHDVIVDPGFGFGKNIEQNFLLLKNLSLFKMLDKPILAGVSRKSMIYKTLNISAQEALNGTTVLNTIALQKQASILRVHDVKEAMECIQLTQQLNL